MLSFSISMKHIDRAKTKFREAENQTSPHESSVLEKLLSIDEETARVMALDMLTAGVDTVSETAIVASGDQNNPISDRRDPNNESPHARNDARKNAPSLALFLDGNAAVSYRDSS